MGPAHQQRVPGHLREEGDVEIDSIEDQSIETPEELLETAYQKIRKSLASELINKVVELSPAFFEKLVVELLVKMGYGGSIKDAGKAMGKSGDEGIDGTIKEDKLGLDIIYIQAKRWRPGNVVGRPELQKFVGALAGQGAKKGIFITTSNFTKEAIEYTPRNETKIVLINTIVIKLFIIKYLSKNSVSIFFVSITEILFLLFVIFCVKFFSFSSCFMFCKIILFLNSLNC